MKKLLFILTFVLFSFKANAFYTIERMYKDCKPLQSSGFNHKNIPKEAIIPTLACKFYFEGMVSAGMGVCGALLALKDNGYNLKTPEFRALKEINANGTTKVFPVITSFLNFAENNANLWKDRISYHKHKFLGTKFPCKLD